MPPGGHRLISGVGAVVRLGGPSAQRVLRPAADLTINLGVFDPQLPLLGQVPIEIAVREGGDTGKPVVVSRPDSEVARAFRDVARQVAARISTANAGPAAAAR